MSRKVQKVIKNAWSEEMVADAIHKIRSVPNSTVRGVATEFGLSECTLRFRLKKMEKGEQLNKAGRKAAFSPDVEENLTQCIAVVCNYGFSPSMKEIQVSYHYFNACHFSVA